MNRDYALFAAIVENGSIAAAGRQLGLSPATASKRLAALERRLGVALAIRTTRRLELTPLGAQFHREIVAILAAVEQIEARLIGSAAAPAGPLRVSAPTSFTRLHVAPYLKQFLDAHPAVELEMQLSDDLTDLIAERFDVAVRITSRIERGQLAHRLATSRRILCAAPLYLATHGIPRSLQQLRDHRLLAAAGQTPWRLVGRGRLAQINADSIVRTNSSELVRELTVAGVGIALRSLWDVSEDIAAGRLVRVLMPYEGSSDVGVYAVLPTTQSTSPAVNAFVAHLRRIYSEPPWER